MGYPEGGGGADEDDLGTDMAHFVQDFNGSSAGAGDNGEEEVDDGWTGDDNENVGGIINPLEFLSVKMEPEGGSQPEVEVGSGGEDDGNAYGYPMDDQGEDLQCPSLDLCSMVNNYGGFTKGVRPRRPPRLIKQKPTIPMPRPGSMIPGSSGTSKYNGGPTTPGGGGGPRRISHGDTQERSKTETPKPLLACQICSRTFVLPYKLEIHMRLHTGERPFKCPDPNCVRAYAANSHLQQHIIKMHGGVAQRKRNRKVIPQPQPVTALKPNPSAAPTNSGANKERQPVVKSEAIHEELNDDGIYPILTLPQDRQFVCPFCFISYRKNVSMIEHLNQVHYPSHGSTAKVSFAENVQEKPRTSLVSKVVEEKKIDNVEGPKMPTVSPEIIGNRCPVCSKRFLTRNKVVIHMRVHTGEKPYQCSICLRRFSQSSHWQRHMRITHQVEGRKPVQSSSDQDAKPLLIDDMLRRTCLVNLVRCDSSNDNLAAAATPNNNSASLSVPQRPSNKARAGGIASRPVPQSVRNKLKFKSGIMPRNQMKCSRCPRLFSNRNELIRHSKTHLANKTLFNCLQCRNVYRHKYSLDVHVSMEHNKPALAALHECPYCDKTFKWNKSLKQHLKKFHELDPSKLPVEKVDPIGTLHECPNCPARFAWKKNLVQHLRLRCPFTVGEK